MNSYRRIFHIIFSYILIFLPIIINFLGYLFTGYDIGFCIKNSIRLYKFIFSSYFEPYYFLITHIILCFFSVHRTIKFWKHPTRKNLSWLYLVNSVLLGIIGIILLMIFRDLFFQSMVSSLSISVRLISFLTGIILSLSLSSPLYWWAINTLRTVVWCIVRIRDNLRKAVLAFL